MGVEDINVEYTDQGTFNVNLEGGEHIEEITGALSKLLYDSYDGGSAGALIGTTSWMYFGDDGEEMAIMGDSRHPLLLKESMPVLDLVPTYMSSLDPLGASLQFGVEPYIICPDKVTVCCWQEKCWGDTKAESEEVSVHMENGNVFIQLKEGNYIYEVIAEWTEPRSVSGSVCYSFCTEKPSMEE